jgi:hypothetical protein
MAWGSRKEQVAMPSCFGFNILYQLSVPISSSDVSSANTI